jgi:hypothetical protein
MPADRLVEGTAGGGRNVVSVFAVGRAVSTEVQHLGSNDVGARALRGGDREREQKRGRSGLRYSPAKAR